MTEGMTDEHREQIEAAKRAIEAYRQRLMESLGRDRWEKIKQEHDKSEQTA